MTAGVAALLLAAAAAGSNRDFAGAREDQLLEYLTGTFASDPLSNPDPDYLEVVLTGMRVLTGRDDGPWLYVEHAVPGSRQAPFRQRVYRFVGRFDSVERRSFTLKEPARFAGAALDATRLDALTLADLVESPGCAIELKPLADGSYSGATRGHDCAWDTPPVAYVTSEVTIGKDALRIRDRAFDAGGKQVWGAKAAPYLFRRVVASSERRATP